MSDGYRREPGMDSWRIQIDELRRKGQKMYGTRWQYTSEPVEAVEDTYGATAGLPNTIIDEVVIGDWFHLECMGDRSYWMNVAGVTVNVLLDKKGVPTVVRVEVDAPVPGCEYP